MLPAVWFYPYWSRKWTKGTPMAEVAIVWLRRALRLADNPALSAALAEAATVLPVFIDAPGDPLSGAAGPAARAWLASSLRSLGHSLTGRGSALVVAEGDPADVLLALARETGATSVHADHLYDPASLGSDARIERALGQAGIPLHTHRCALLGEPDFPRTTTGGPFKVFTAYHRARLREEQAPLTTPAPEGIPLPPLVHVHRDLFERAPALAEGTPGAPPLLLERFEPGEAGAHAALGRFLAGPVAQYAHDRDAFGTDGTSRLSAHLAFGEIAPWRIAAAVDEAVGGDPSLREGTEGFLRQLHWREFAHHLLHHFPETVARPLRPEFERFGWAEDPTGLEAWKAGRTGYPLVDAGMRELLATGWMHNRVRMIAASFLTKHLLLPWQLGAAHFTERLADADVANNTFGWQWVAGSGADAAPYFRIFNPVTQGERYDPPGTYVRTWLPELAGLPDHVVHRPWMAPAEELDQAGVALGETYPLPIIDHREARERALAAYRETRR